MNVLRLKGFTVGSSSHEPTEMRKCEMMTSYYFGGGVHSASIMLRNRDVGSLTGIGLSTCTLMDDTMANQDGEPGRLE